MTTFNQIYVLDLHGNATKKERAPDGSDDQNVFDIKQGVAISLFIKSKNLERGVWHADLWGNRLAKYLEAAQISKSSINWTWLKPEKPDWMFKPQNAVLARRYRKFWSLPEIFAPMGDPAPGIVTTHDDFAVSFTRTEAQKKVRDLLATANEAEARSLFTLCGQSQWSYATAKEELPQINLKAKSVPLGYRPFDTRWTIWDSNVAVHRRERVMRHMLSDNVAIATSRQAGVIGSPEFDAVMAVNKPVDFNFFRRGGEYIFPLYLLPKDNAGVQNSVGRRAENLSTDFRTFIDNRYDHHYAPEDILGYIYAILHAQGYRIHFAEFLRTDFPRIPFSEKAEAFERLSALGWALMEAHLMREFPRKSSAAYHGKGDHTIEGVRYSPQEQAIHINKAQYFRPVPQTVWDFHIGGYRVLEKYLKSRRDRVLSLDEINHVGAVADCLAFTIGQMAAIDKAYRRAFPDQA